MLGALLGEGVPEAALLAVDLGGGCLRVGDGFLAGQRMKGDGSLE